MNIKSEYDKAIENIRNPKRNKGSGGHSYLDDMARDDELVKLRKSIFMLLTAFLKREENIFYDFSAKTRIRYSGETSAPKENVCLFITPAYVVNDRIWKRDFLFFTRSIAEGLTVLNMTIEDCPGDPIDKISDK